MQPVLCSLPTDMIRPDSPSPGRRWATPFASLQPEHRQAGVVPIHSDVVRMGFLEHVQRMNVNGPSRVFPELIPKRAQLGHAPSKWFGRYRHKRGVTDPRKVFHSFRHTFIDDLREAGVQDSIIKRLVGHEDGSMTFGLYGSREPIKVMAQAVAMLKVERHCEGQGGWQVQR